MGFSMVTAVYGGMLRVIQADEPTTEWWPMVVLPPRIVALA
jgi:hypothetical protein